MQDLFGVLYHLKECKYLTISVFNRLLQFDFVYTEISDKPSELAVNSMKKNMAINITNAVTIIIPSLIGDFFKRSVESLFNGHSEKGTLY